MIEIYIYNLNYLVSDVDSKLSHNVLIHTENYDNKRKQISRSNYYYLNEKLKTFGTGTEKITFMKTGKPIIDNLFISISHSNSLFGFAISQENVGLDFEEISRFNDFRLKKRFNEDNGIEAIATKWTIMEAMAKLDGSCLNKNFLTKKPKYSKNFVLQDNMISVVSDKEISLVNIYLNDKKILI